MTGPDAHRRPGRTGRRAIDQQAKRIAKEATRAGYVEVEVDLPPAALAAQDRASAADRAYFAEHPDENERVRLALPDEFPCVAWVRVRQISTGLRIRTPWTAAA